MTKLQSIYNVIYSKYLEKQKVTISYYFNKIKKIEINTDTFNFYNAVSSMASSKIEGEIMDIDSFVRHKVNNVKYIKALTEKPNDLFNAYVFAQSNTLNKSNVLKAHKLISKNLLHKHWQGKIRSSDMVIRDKNKIIYEACLKENVSEEFDAFFKEIEVIIKTKLSLHETFFYASLIHLVFVNIHPFDDGNGRTGRLIEKWFLAEKLGEKAWFIQNDYYYWMNKNDFYKNLNQLGFMYEKLNYNKAIPFLLMLPNSLK